MRGPLRKAMAVLMTAFFGMQAFAFAESGGGLTDEEFAALEQSEGFKAMQVSPPLAANSENLDKWVINAKSAKLNFVTDVISSKTTYDVIIQGGHLKRTKGYTGTTGALITEQEGTALVASLLRPLLEEQGIRYAIIDADSHKSGSTIDGTNFFKTQIFVSLHLDGSKKPCASSASLGYNQELGKQSMQSGSGSCNCD